MEEPESLSLKRRAEELINNGVADPHQYILPKKSKERYDEEYKKFCSWLEKENIERGSVSDEIMLVYLSELAKAMKPTTLWRKYSMIKSNFKVFENVDFSSFSKCSAFLKRKSDGYVPTKSRVFTVDQVTKFLTEASDKEWLLSKVILIIGVFGACGKDDLLNLKFQNVIDNGNYFKFFLKDASRSRNRNNRSFTITDDGFPFKPCILIRKYMSMRPVSMTSERFFIGYRRGKCVAQHVGTNSIAVVPYKVAKYLGLENPQQYTGNAFRRTSATLLIERRGDFPYSTRNGGLRSSTIAERYVMDSIARKIQLQEESKQLVTPLTSSTSTEILDSTSTTEEVVSSSHVNRTKSLECEENEDSSNLVQTECVKDELAVEDDENSEGTFLESESNDDASEESNDDPLIPKDPEASFETIICEGGIQIKQEIDEDDMGVVESSPCQSNSANSSLEPYKSVSVKTPVVSVVSTPDHPPIDNTSCASDSEDLDEVVKSLKKIPIQRRSRTKDKLLRLVKLISEWDVDPDQVSFSVTTK